MPYGLTVIEGVIANIAYPPLNTGTDENTVIPDNSGINIYPNPASDYISVKFDTWKNEEYTLKIIDFSGKVIFSSCEKSNISGENNYFLNFKTITGTQLLPGIYLLIAETGRKTLTGKFIVNGSR